MPPFRPASAQQPAVSPSYVGPLPAISDSLSASRAIEINAPQARLRPAARFYRPELDVLRFFAFFGVFFYHNGSYSASFFEKHHLPAGLGVLERSIAGAGAFGVDLFFVLSAYLITELLLREKESRGSLDVPSFYLRRILRIWPLYYAFIAMVALLPAFGPDRRFGASYVIPFLFLAGNWSCVVFGFPLHSVMALLWSVCIEEQFYLLWPPIVSRLSRRNILYAGLAMLAIANAARLIAAFVQVQQPQVWCNTLMRLDPIALGIILVMLFHEGVPSFRTSTRVLFLLFGLCDLFLVARYANPTEEVSPLSWQSTVLGYPAVAAGCALILLSILNSQSRVAASPALRYLGKISYGLYVYHLLATWVADRILAIPSGTARGGLRFVLALAITIAAAAVSYRFLETPFLNLKRKFTYVPSRPV